VSPRGNRNAAKPAAKRRPQTKIKMKTYTYSEIANDFTLWGQYVDTAGLDSRERFDGMTVADKIAFQKDCFGAE